MLPNLYTTNTSEVIIGANIKYLIGFNGAYIKSKNAIKFEAEPTITGTIDHPDADIYASNYDIKAGCSYQL